MPMRAPCQQHINYTCLQQHYLCCHSYLQLVKYLGECSMLTTIAEVVLTTAEGALVHQLAARHLSTSTAISRHGACDLSSWS